MRGGEGHLIRSVAFRAVGLALLIGGGLAMRHLCHLVHLPPGHSASAAEMAAAAFGFMSLSAGSVLTLLGVHVLDRIEVSERWERRPAQPSHLVFAAPAEEGVTPSAQIFHRLRHGAAVR